MKKKSDIGIYGLGVMGKNITLNLIDKGFLVSVYNRSTNKEVDVVNNFVSEINDISIKGYIDLLIHFKFYLKNCLKNKSKI